MDVPISQEKPSSQIGPFEMLNFLIVTKECKLNLKKNKNNRKEKLYFILF